MVAERDTAVKLRDGSTIYTDVFCHVDHDTGPAVVAWDPNGKDIRVQWLVNVPEQVGVPFARGRQLAEGKFTSIQCSNRR